MPVTTRSGNKPKYGPTPKRTASKPKKTAAKPKKPSSRRNKNTSGSKTISLKSESISGAIPQHNTAEHERPVGELPTQKQLKSAHPSPPKTDSEEIKKWYTFIHQLVRLISLPEYVWITATHLFYIVANDSDVRAFTSQSMDELELVCAACVVHAISMNRLEVDMPKIAAQLRNLSCDLTPLGAHSTADIENMVDDLDPSFEGLERPALTGEIPVIRAEEDDTRFGPFAMVEGGWLIRADPGYP